MSIEKMTRINGGLFACQDIGMHKLYATLQSVTDIPVIDDGMQIWSKKEKDVDLYLDAVYT